MRTLLFIALLGLAGCEDKFEDTKKVDSVAAWETFLKDAGPSQSQEIWAKDRIETILIKQARDSADLAKYDEVIKRFPKSREIKKLKEERSKAAYEAAVVENTPDGWKKFLAENDYADGALKKKARGLVEMSQYADKLGITEVKVEGVNLAEDPKGPKDGWGFTCEITNNGDKAIEYLNLELSVYDAEGNKLGKRPIQYPLVAIGLPGNMPVPENFEVPVKPGETRTWTYASGDVGDAPKSAKILPLSIRFVEAK